MNAAQPPTLPQKVAAAIYVISMWPDMPGVSTINTLMWPYKKPPLLEADRAGSAGPWIEGPDDVRRQAVRVLASACTALLAAAPPALNEQIWKDQDEYLSFALGDGTPCDASQFLAVELPAQAE